MYSIREIWKKVVQVRQCGTNKGRGVETYQLICEEQNGFQTELAIAEIEKVLEGGTKKVEHHGVIVTFGPVPSDEGYTDTTRHCFVDLGFIFELGVFGFDRFKLDGNFLPRNDVDS
jgi:hypothetical protein